MKKRLRGWYIAAAYHFSRLFNYPLVRPAFIQVNLTTRCNLRCRICTNFQYPSDPGQELTGKEIKAVILQGQKMGIRQIVFSGGEPFLRDDLFEILEFIKENTLMKVTITTNATLIDAGMAEKITDAGSIANLQISLDGASEKTHDSVRGQGTFAKTIQAIKLLNQARNNTLSIGASFTIIAANYAEMPAFLDLCRQLNIDQVLFIPFIEDNTYTHKNYSLRDLLLKKEALSAFGPILAAVADFKSRYDRPVISNFENLFLYEKYFAGRLDNRYWQCFAGFHWIQVNPHGDMRMCEWPYGTLRGNKSLPEIWNSREACAARIKIKGCKRLCLQPCMTKPD